MEKFVETFVPLVETETPSQSFVNIPLVDTNPPEPLDPTEYWLASQTGTYKGRDGVERPSTHRRVVIIRPDGQGYAVESGGILKGRQVDASHIHGINAVRYIHREEKPEEVQYLLQQGFVLYEGESNAR